MDQQIRSLLHFLAMYCYLHEVPLESSQVLKYSPSSASLVEIAKLAHCPFKKIWD